MEVVSASNPGHDRLKKRREYARAGIPEYWIVDPLKGTITVLALRRRVYVVNGEFAEGHTARSGLLAGFGLSVTAALEAH